jgi:hypothetical protein
MHISMPYGNISYHHKKLAFDGALHHNCSVSSIFPKKVDSARWFPAGFFSPSLNKIQGSAQQCHGRNDEQAGYVLSDSSPASPTCPGASRYSRSSPL